MEITGFAYTDPDKKRCGDAYVFRHYENQGLILACLSDGVGSMADDWRASRLTVDTVLSVFDSHGGAPGVRLADSVWAANEAVKSANRDAPARMAATCIACVWEYERSRLWWVNYGDSRLHVLQNSTLDCVSRDNSKTVFKRGEGGKFKLVNGVPVTQTGITSAMGTAEKIQPAQERTSENCFAIILSSDGYYNCSSFNQTGLWQLVNCMDLPGAVALEPIKDQIRDDASAVFIRHTKVPGSIKQDVLSWIERGEAFEGSGVPPYFAASVLLEELNSAMEKGDWQRTGILWDFSENCSINFGRKILGNIIKVIVEKATSRQDSSNIAVKRLYNKMVSAIRNNRTP